MVTYVSALSADGLSAHLLDIHLQKAIVELTNEIEFFLFLTTTSQLQVGNQRFEVVALGSEALSRQVTCLQPVKIAGL